MRQQPLPVREGHQPVPLGECLPSPAQAPEEQLLCGVPRGGVHVLLPVRSALRQDGAQREGQIQFHCF